MRFRKRKPTEVCQNCKHANNEKGKYKHTLKRRSIYPRGSQERKESKGYWHIFCELKEKYYPWDYRKRCFELRKF